MLKTGQFVKSFGSTRRRQVALGAPRAGDRREGTVYIVETSKNSQNVYGKIRLRGEKSGEYFGASLLSMDINKDGFDDLIVGSPLYTHVEQSKSTVGYEEGKISIYTINNRNSDSFDQKYVRYGPGGPGARFGAALVDLGDLDEDGYGDFAVGAPFEENGKGVVRLYYGQKDIAQIRGKYIFF